MYSDKKFRLAKCPEQNTFTGSKTRIQFISEKILRIEWDEFGNFEDRQTLAIINRDIENVDFDVKKQDNVYLIKSNHFLIEFKDDGNIPAKDNFRVTFTVNEKEEQWYPGKSDEGNLGGTARTLDCANGDKRKVPMEKRTISNLELYRAEEIDLKDGLISRSGWSCYDDSRNVVLDEIDGKKWVKARPENKRLDVYLFAYGNDFKATLQNSAEIFGSQPLPPRYAFGYWWSRYWAYSDSQLEELAKSFEKYDVPIDVLVIDMDWHLEGWTGYTWDKRYFPDPEDHLKWLHKHGLKAALNLHPADGVAKHEEQFEEMAKAMNLDPQKIDKVEFDVTDPACIDNYFKVLLHPMEKSGIDFWWMDWQQGESSKMPGLDPLPWINQLHWEDLEDRPEKNGARPLIFSRYGGYGAGRYNIGFSGDTFSSWDSLAYQPYFTATACNVLYGYWSHDIGGHIPGAIEPELYTRWIQFGVYSPVLRTHTTKNSDAERRVWEYPGPYSDIMIEMLRLRYMLVPYIYSEARKCYENGTSLCRAMYIDYPNSEEAYDCPGQYMFGDKMLLAPVTSPVCKDCEMAEVEIWLPEGNWIDTARGCVEHGGKTIKRRYMINEVPVFVQSGSIIPMQSEASRLNDAYYKNLLFKIYPGDAGNYTLYEDDGRSVDYLKDKYVLFDISHSLKDKYWEIEVGKKSGSFDGYSPIRNLELHLKMSLPPVKIIVAGREIEHNSRPEEITCGWSYDGNTATVIIKLADVNFDEKLKIKVEYNNIDDLHLIDGLEGLLRRLERVNYLNTTLTAPAILHPEERLGQDLAHIGIRISRSPESYKSELIRLKNKLPDLKAMLDELGRTARSPWTNDSERLKTAQRAINIIEKSGY